MIMKKEVKRIKGIFLIGLIGLMFSSCDTLYPDYEVRVQNNCENDITIMGTTLPFMYYDIVEVTLGDKTFTDIKNGNYSDYQTVKSGEEYDITITYDSYIYDTENYKWEYEGQYTESKGTETWAANETYDKFKIKVEIGNLIQLYKPQIEVYGEE